MPISNKKDLMYQIMENMTGMIRIVDKNNSILYMNKRMREEFGDLTGKKCHEMFCKSVKCEICIGMDSIKKEEVQAKEVVYNGKVYRIMASPARDSDGAMYSIEIFYDITEQKMLEEEFHKHYLKLKGDIEFAKQIQKKALPDDDVYWDSIRVSSSYYPSEDLSGDLFDVIKVNDDSVAFYISDVSGHGVRSSLLTIFLRQVIRGMKATAADPTAVLNQIIKDYDDLNLDKEQYISFIYGVYNCRTKGLSLVNAGHNCLPLVIEEGKNGKIKFTELEIKGMPICSLIKSSHHEIINLQMEQGDQIVLYTDGITEAYNKDREEELGLEGLKEIITRCKGDTGKDLAKIITDEARFFAKDSPMDDMACLVVKIL